MKPFYWLAALLLITTCMHPAPATGTDNSTEGSIFQGQPQDTADDIAEATTTESTDKSATIIYTEDGDTVAYTHAILDKILYYYPRLNSSPDVLSPDESYNLEVGNWENYSPTDKERLYSFGSLAGQDEYSLLYSYFLKGRNNTANERIRRKKLVAIYRAVNNIHAQLNEGGTYFGHQYKRILAYAEYAIYQHIHYPEYDKKDYDITEQKKAYLQYLSRFIKDETEADTGYPSSYKKRRVAKMLAKVTELDALITDNFYLSRAIQFNTNYY